MSAESLPALTASDRAALLALARSAIVAHLDHLPPPSTTNLPHRLGAEQDAFVSLRIKGELRGCIGMVNAHRALSEVVTHCAAGASSDDPRFPTLALDELGSLRIEISALSPAEVIESPDRLQTGRHGVIVSRGTRQGLLLPQVAVEQGWDRATLLRQACRKAGLPPDAWQHGARIQIFEADVFAERSPV